MSNHDITEAARLLQEEVNRLGDCFIVGNSDNLLYVYSNDKDKMCNISEFDGYPVVEKHIGE